MTRLAYAVLVLAACVQSEPASDLELATDDTLDQAPSDGGKADAPGWSPTSTLHAGVPAFDRADAHGRTVHPLWLAGRPGAPVSLVVRADAAEGDVRIAVLGPLRNGTRAVLAADGYTARKGTAAVTIDTRETGEHLVVVGSYQLATEVSYELSATCVKACAGNVDVLATPKAGALVGEGRLLQATLGDVLGSRAFDVELEVWAAPPMQWWNATKVATSVASGNQVNVLVPASVKDGDDLVLVVREAGGRVLDTGFVTRFVAQPRSFARTDAILYGDLVSLQIAGVVGYFEGVAELALRSETRGVEIARHALHAELPGATGLGFGAFDATFAPELADEDGTLNPNLPRNGDVLSVGFLNGDAKYVRLGCFEYCNDLSGMETCTGGPRACQ